ncbi:hypothetical protein Athai_50910 [Actinocatenispora thailandica]|jgi:hypothetical protein|uniref:Helix-turn-helix domain-containing protein n=1 Tax=Actinocatenispora thailandica TaxID=227318 RepID=A0A7R7DTL9_9ACTN|nr:helix-turn-helix domain-containing protein [Actinocatenispora thailandica]BCJ37588.1 hypothetical protein Athai_50910 [Actinocatenispora thailandica]
MTTPNMTMTSLSDLPALISIPLAGEILGLTRATAYRYAASGDLPVKRFGGRRVYVITARLRAIVEGTEETVQ